MKNKKWLFLVFAVFLLVFFICYDKVFINDKVSDEKKVNKVIESKVDSVIKNMTIEEKIGQMLIVNYGNPIFNDKFKEYFNSVRPGGIILTKENITTYDDTLDLVKNLKDSSKYPLIVSVDQEGGRVQRLKYLSDVLPTDIPDMYSLGGTHDEELAYEVGKVLAEELRTIGVNVVFAPVIDVFSNPLNSVIGNRSFGNDVDTVVRMSLSLSKGLKDNGIVATYKHFPGHGDTNVDSHVGLPVINKTLEDALSLEFIPFKEAIKNDAKIIMTAHIAFPNITGDMIPASMSKVMLTDILRSKLGFEGLIITDAVNMKALTDNYSYEEILVKSIEAGSDFILIPKDEVYTINYIKENISEERINESVKRILSFKFENLENYEYLDKSYLGSEEHKKVVEKIIELNS
jgi:beta-N-acetylhexosaminidase